MPSTDSNVEEKYSTKFEDTDLELAAKQLLHEVETNPVDEMRLYVFEEMLNLLKNVPNQFEAIAISRLALMGSVTGLVKQNAEVISLVQNIFEKFDIKVTVTQVNGENIYQRELPIKVNERYDLTTLQMAGVALIAKLNGIIAESARLQSEVSSNQSLIESLKRETSNQSNRIKELASVPPPPAIDKPFRLVRISVKDGETQYRYIGKCETNGYKVTRSLAKALAWEDAGKAIERLVHLNQNATDYPIPSIYDYQLIGLHYLPHTGKVSPELQLALAQARTRAAKNLGAKNETA